MIFRSDLQIETITRAMLDVIMPAIDPDNQPALEQAQVIVGTLMVMGRALPLQFRFDCDELSRLVEFADSLDDEIGADPSVSQVLGPLREAAHRSRDVLERAQADPCEVVGAVRAMRATSDALVDAVFRNQDAGRHRDAVQRIVLSMTREQVLRERAWTVSQGFDANAATLPPIESLIGEPRKF